MICTVLAMLLAPPTAVSRLNAVLARGDEAELSRLAPQAAVRNPRNWVAEQLPSIGDGPALVIVRPKAKHSPFDDVVLQDVGGKLKYLPSDRVSIEHHSFYFRSSKASDMPDLIDEVEFKASSKGSQIILRIAPQYKVLNIGDGNGEPVTFKQVDGILRVHRPLGPKFSYRFYYDRTPVSTRDAICPLAREVTFGPEIWFPTISRQVVGFDVQFIEEPGWKVVEPRPALFAGSAAGTLKIAFQRP